MALNMTKIQASYRLACSQLKRWQLDDEDKYTDGTKATKKNHKRNQICNAIKQTHKRADTRALKHTQVRRARTETHIQMQTHTNFSCFLVSFIRLPDDDFAGLWSWHNPQRFRRRVEEKRYREISELTRGVRQGTSGTSVDVPDARYHIFF